MFTEFPARMRAALAVAPAPVGAPLPPAAKLIVLPKTPKESNLTNRAFTSAVGMLFPLQSHVVPAHDVKLGRFSPVRVVPAAIKSPPKVARDTRFTVLRTVLSQMFIVVPTLERRGAERDTRLGWRTQNRVALMLVRTGRLIVVKNDIFPPRVSSKEKYSP